MTTTPVRRPDPTGTPSPPLLRGHVADRLGVALALVAATAALLNLAFPDQLGGEAVMRGNLLGTSVVVLLAAAVLLAALRAGSRGSARAGRWLVVRGGASAYLLYQGVMFCLATPLNRFFLVYVAHLGLGLWALIALARTTDLAAFEARVGPHVPTRGVAAAAVAFAALNGLTWLAGAVPAVLSDDPAAVLDGSGLLTNPVWVQDLAFWVPATILAAVTLWRHRPGGALGTGVLLTFFSLECVSIAADQWWGHSMDPDQPVWASLSAVPLFAVLALLTAVPVGWLLRHVDAAR